MKTFIAGAVLGLITSLCFVSILGWFMILDSGMYILAFVYLTVMSSFWFGVWSYFLSDEEVEDK